VIDSRVHREQIRKAGLRRKREFAVVVAPVLQSVSIGEIEVVAGAEEVFP